MRGVNKVILVGNLGRDPEVRYTRDGTAVERWSYDTPNVKGRIDFIAEKVAKSEGENVQDTEAAKKKKAVRRGTTASAER